MSLEIAAKAELGGFTLDVEFASEGRITGIFGRSGSGKTTIVNVIAGLLRPEAGRIVVDGEVLFDSADGIDVPSYRRRVGYVFQDSRLFPQFSVKQNLLYGRWFTPKRRRYGSFGEVVQLLGIGPLLERSTAQLSGGEEQRVAIGRALLASPRLLLLDEPLASLDDSRKAELTPYLERLRDHAHVPMVYVSHSVAEIARLTTSLVLLADGRVMASGPTAEVLGRTDIAPLAGTSDAGAVLEAIVTEHEPASGLSTLRSRAGSFRVARLDFPAGTPVRMRIRARDVIVAVERPEKLSALNVLEGTVVEIGPPKGPLADIAIDCGGERLVAQLTRYSIEALKLVPGRKVYAVVKSVTLDQVSGIGGQIVPGTDVTADC